MRDGSRLSIIWLATISTSVAGAPAIKMGVLYPAAIVLSSEDPAFRMMLPATLHPRSAAANLIPATGALSITLFAIVRFSADCPPVDHHPMPIEALLAGRGAISRSKITVLPDMITFATGRLEFGSKTIPNVVLAVHGAPA